MAVIPGQCVREAHHSLSIITDQGLQQNLLPASQVAAVPPKEAGGRSLPGSTTATTDHGSRFLPEAYGFDSRQQDSGKGVWHATCIVSDSGWVCRQGGTVLPKPCSREKGVTMAPRHQATVNFPAGAKPRNLVLLARADPIICGHSTEARNLAEAALAAGFERVHIVSYPLDVLAASGLPLKPLESVAGYSAGISVDRPAAIGDYKVLDGRLGYAIAGHLVDLVTAFQGGTVVMNLYLVPHGQMVMQAVQTLRGIVDVPAPTTIAEAVGSDITNVVSNALETGQIGAAATVLQNYLDHDLPVAVSQFTKDLIVAAGGQVDEHLGTRYGSALEARVGISYPAIDTAAYLTPPAAAEQVAGLARRGLGPMAICCFSAGWPSRRASTT